MVGMIGIPVFANEKDLTPLEYSHLSRKDKLKYKTVIIKWGGEDIYFQEKLPDFAERIFTSDLETPREWYSRSLFMLTHPKVKIESGVYGYTAEEQMPLIAAGTGCSVIPIIASGGPQMWIEKGLIQDITELVRNWDQNAYLSKNFPEIWKMCWKGNKCYAVPRGDCETRTYAFRKDWFKEAGIFNSRGEPRPEDNWTWTDLRKIAVKLTNVKKNRWGFGWMPRLWAVPGDIAYSYGLFNQRAFVVPDRSGKYTWRFEAAEPLVKACQYLHDLKWKYKCMLTDLSMTSPWDMLTKEFEGGRVGITLTPTVTQWRYSTRPSPFNPEHAYVDDVGLTTFPVGEETGVAPNMVYSMLYGFVATLNKEELKAAFEYWDWERCGKGRTLLLERIADEYSLLGKEVYPIELASYVYKLEEIPKGLPLPAKIIPEEFLKVHKKACMVPRQPYPEEFGLQLNCLYGLSLAYPYLKACWEGMLTKEDWNAKVELEKTGERINKESLNYKIPNDTEKFKEYYAAVKSFYKKNYPKFYESKAFKQQWEKYYTFGEIN